MDRAFGAVPGAVVGQTIFVQAHLQSGIAEKGIDIPGGRPVHRHQPSLFGGDICHSVQTLYVFIGKISFVIIEKISIVSCQRVGIKGAVYGGRIYRR